MTKTLIVSGKRVLVDAGFFELLRGFTWTLDPSGYPRATIPYEGRKRQVRMHTFLGWSGEKGKCADHINGNKLDNRVCNLRMVTYSVNAHNKPQQKEGYRGVRSNGHGKFMARITVKRVPIYLGTYASEELAAEVYNAAARFYYGPNARINKVKQRREK